MSNTGTVAVPAQNDAAPGYAWYVVSVLLFTSILGYIDRLVFAFLVEPIKAELSLSDTQMGLLNGFAFTVFYVIMGIPLGRLVDIRNRTRLLAFCVALWSAMTALCGTATSYLSMFIARVGVGIGEAGLNPAAVSLISDLFSKEKVTRPISVFTMSFYIGGGLAILLGGQLVEYFSGLGAISLFGFDNISGWRLVFVIVGLSGFVAVALILFSVREPARRREAARPGVEELTHYTVRDIVDYARAHRALYFWLYGGLLLFGFYMYGLQGWFAAMLMRSFDASPGEISVPFGSIYLGFGVLGALAVGPIVARLQQRGYADAHIVLCMLAMAGMTVPAIIAPHMPGADAALAMFAVIKFCWALTITVGFAAIAVVTPGAMRGLMTSLFLVLMNVTGGAFGAVLIGLLSDYVVGGENLGLAMSIVAGVFLPLATLFFFLGRPAFRAHAIAIQEQEIHD
jgi:MFS family permease